VAKRPRYRIEDEAEIEVEGISCVNFRIYANGKSEYFDVIQWDANETALEMSRYDIIWDFIWSDTLRREK
jgi:hypothetical protein